MKYVKLLSLHELIQCLHNHRVISTLMEYKDPTVERLPYDAVLEMVLTDIIDMIICRELSVSYKLSNYKALGVMIDRNTLIPLYISIILESWKLVELLSNEHFLSGIVDSPKQSGAISISDDYILLLQQEL